MGRLTFVRGSSYQLTPAFTLDVYKMSTQVTTNEAVRAGAEVVKQQATPLLSSLLYPILQALDEEVCARPPTPLSLSSYTNLVVKQTYSHFVSPPL